MLVVWKAALRISDAASRSASAALFGLDDAALEVRQKASRLDILDSWRRKAREYAAEETAAVGGGAATERVMLSYNWDHQSVILST